MAEKQAGGLNLRIGLTLSQLQSDFLAAEQTIRQGMANLNRQQNLVKIRMDADITGLDAVADKTKILEIQERGLTQLLEMQRDKLTLATAAYKDYAASKGANDVGAKKLETAMERERLAVARLEAELKNLSAQKVSIDTSRLNENISRITAQIQQVRIKAEFDTSQLSGATAAFDAQKIHIAAVTRELELQRQKLLQLQGAMYKSAQQNGGNHVQTINIKSNVFTQLQEIQRLEQKLKELQNTNVNLQIRNDSIQKAEQAINESIARLNARVENIRVKAEVDVSKLGAAASEFDKAKLHVSALNRELELQTQKLAELKKAFAMSVSSNGLNNVKTINLGTDIQRQIREIDQLKAKIEELNKIQPPKTNNLLSGYLNIKGDISGKLNNITSAFNGITSASHSADGAISKSLEIIGAIPHPAGKAVAALASIPLIIKGVENSLLSMAESVVASGDAFYVMSRGMQLSIADAAKLSTIAKVTGIEINEVNNTMRRFSMQLTKGGEKSSLMAQTLNRYGAELTDETGRMKNELELAQELGKAFREAQAEGNGAAFRDIVGGKFWSGDFVTFLEDLADNTEAAKQVVKNGLANPAFAHQIQGEINTLNAQLGQLGGVFESALLPVVHEIVPRATERFGELTKVIQANKENIKFLGDVMATPVRLLNEMTDGVISLSTAIEEAQAEGSKLGNFFTMLGNYRDDVGALLNIAPAKTLGAIFSPSVGATGLLINNYRAEIDAYKKAQAEAADAAKAKQDEANAKREKELALNKANLDAQQKLETALASSEERRIKFTQEAEDTIYGIRSGSYEKQLREHERWQDAELSKIQELQELGKNILGEEGLFDDEEAAFYELDNAKILQIEHEKEERLKEIRQRITEAEKTEIQKRMTAIDAEKEKWIQAGMERAEAEKLAERQKTQAVKELEKDVAANVNSIWQTELENRLAQIDREKQAWIQKGVDEVKATQWAEQAKADAQRNAAMNVIKQQAEEYEAYQKGGFAGLQAYKFAQLVKSGVNPEYLNMTPQQLAQFQKANNVAEKAMLPNFMTAQDKADYRNQMATVRDRQRQRDEQNYAIVNGEKIGLNEATGGEPIRIEIGDSEVEQSDDGRVTLRDYDTDKNGNVTSMTERDFSLPEVINDVSANLSDLPTTFQGVSESFSEIPMAVQSATEALYEIPTAVLEATENLSAMETPQIEELANPFSALEPEIEATAQKFSSMTLGVEEVTIKLNDLTAALGNLSLQKENSQPAEIKTPVNVNVTVQIEEAHAWDSEHIQQLADKVADEIKPEVISAIGGDSNSY